MSFKIPNVFTPNGDGTNDLFKLINPQNIKTIAVSVLNRWGNLVFESNKVNFKWNGSRLNEKGDCDDGVYFYKITLTSYSGKKIKQNGYVHLYRDKK